MKRRRNEEFPALEGHQKKKTKRQRSSAKKNDEFYIDQDTGTHFMAQVGITASSSNSTSSSGPVDILSTQVAHLSQPVQIASTCAPPSIPSLTTSLVATDHAHLPQQPGQAASVPTYFYSQGAVNPIYLPQHFVQVASSQCALRPSALSVPTLITSHIAIDPAYVSQQSLQVTSGPCSHPCQHSPIIMENLTPTVLPPRADLTQATVKVENDDDDVVFLDSVHYVKVESVAVEFADNVEDGSREDGNIGNKELAKEVSSDTVRVSLPAPSDLNRDDDLVIRLDSNYHIVELAPESDTVECDQNAEDSNRENCIIGNKKLVKEVSSNTVGGKTDKNRPIIVGTIVWANFQRGRFIGIVIPSLPILKSDCSPNTKNIFWFGEGNISKVPISQIVHFLDVSEDDQVQLNKSGLKEALETIVSQYGIERPEISPVVDIQEFMNWIAQNKEKFNNCDYVIPDYILTSIEKINNKGMAIDPEDGPSKGAKIPPVRNFTVAYHDRNPDKICLGCREITNRNQPHPLLRGILCSNCHVRVIKNLMELRSNAKYYKYCAVCGWLDKYIYCYTCKRVICRICFMFWFEKPSFEIVAKDGYYWNCFFCLKTFDPAQDHRTNLKVKDTSPSEICTLRQSQEIWPQNDVIISADDKGGRPEIRVLSLFDGISTGMEALSKLKIKVDKYFAAEIDKNAIMVSKRRFGDGVEQIGDVRDITSHTITKYLPIHLVIGGSPCNDLSRVNHERKGLTDMSGSGPMFFEYYRIMKLIEEHQGHPRNYYYLYENVASMDQTHRDTISRFFETSYVCIDAKHVSAMKRPRLFWSNIPNIDSLSQLGDNPGFTQETSETTTLQAHLTPNLKRSARVQKIRTVTTNANCLSKTDGTSQVIMDGKASTLSITELERVFGLPEHFTDVMSLSPRSRLALLGKAWCVPVITALLRPLTSVFKLVDQSELPSSGISNVRQDNVVPGPSGISKK